MRAAGTDSDIVRSCFFGNPDVFRGAFQIEADREVGALWRLHNGATVAKAVAHTQVTVDNEKEFRVARRHLRMGRRGIFPQVALSQAKLWDGE
jgi:hypothetical protein